MRARKLLALALWAACAVASSACAGRSSRYVPLDAKVLRGDGQIYFVPLGDFPTDKVQGLRLYYRQKYGLSIKTLARLPLDASVVSSERQQLAAEEVVALMKGAHPELVADPRAILIGLTDDDMYIEHYTWQYTFSWRQEGRYAVVSDARMTLARASEELSESRLRKMVTKNIGVIYYRLAQSGDPRSVLYKNVGGLRELDRMGEDF
jgi:predicted Zn-dependent protease